MSALAVEPGPLAGLALVRRARRGDDRGFLARLFCDETLRAAGWPGPVRQVNHTRTTVRGCVRGLHLQRAPHADAKLVSCIRGRVFDVAVDLRPASPTRGRWHGVTLSAEAGTALLIPAGFAHGFQALDDEVELLYCHAAAHAPQAEAGVHPLDPALAIGWPLPVALMSARDRGLPTLDAALTAEAALTGEPA